jgi:hypothetical protein
VTETRLYRQTAARTGDARITGVLDELERVLVDITHAPSNMTQPQLEELRQRLEAEGILFKIRVLGANVRKQEVRRKRRPPDTLKEKEHESLSNLTTVCCLLATALLAFAQTPRPGPPPPAATAPVAPLPPDVPEYRPDSRPCPRRRRSRWPPHGADAAHGHRSGRPRLDLAGQRADADRPGPAGSKMLGDLDACRCRRPKR